MATTATQVVDPRGDVLLYFPGQSDNQQRAAAAEPTRASPYSPQTVCNELDRRSADLTSASFATPDNRSVANNHDPSSKAPVCLRVSSSVLCLASPVFSAMLSGSMAEAAAFRAADSPRPFPLTLPEDDGHVFSILAHVMHFRPDSVPYLPSTSTLLALAALVDKYDCAAALMCYGEIWLNRAIERGRDEAEFGGFEQRCELMLFAYALDLPAPFAQLSWDVIMEHRQQLKDETEHGLDLPVRKDHELLRHDLHGITCSSSKLSDDWKMSLKLIGS